MLEIKNLCKTYKAKGGVITKALDNVSVVFPEKGMVFLLGKSGSGKSTLLNVTGGLDKPDSGEIIIKGRNSKTFSGSDFDSYRNTFIGFIFQDYNILNEFNVEQNIGLALQLQGKPHDKKAVDAILKQVDLDGFGKRKPNTLSGGQKQRIAIARALIKNPEIIMADEPTGALDSKTGQQVFDTLKKLSREKLVIVVSHDRDFAEIYGDRIIELSDGKILSDVTKFVVDSKKISDNVQIVNPNTVTIKNSAALTPQDINQIYALLRSKSGEVVISSGEHDVKAVKQATHIRADNKSEIFNATRKQEAPNYDGKKTKFIRSRLPFSRAFKMGSATLKLKPGRMILTILLTTVALTMFGVTSTLMLYDQSYALNSALKSLPNDSEVIQKKYNVTRHYVTYNQDFTVDEDTKNEDKNAAIIGKADIVDLNNNNVGHKYAGVVTSGGWGDESPLGLSNFTSNSYYYAYFDFGGLIDAGEEYMNDAGFSLLSGAYPTTKNELAISKFMYESMKADTSKGIKSYSDVVGHSFQFGLRNYMTSVTKDLTITGIYDVGEVPAAFNDIKDGNPTELLKSQYDEYIKSSFHTAGFVAPSFIDENDYKPVARNNGGTSYNFSLKSSSFESYIENIEDEYRQASFYPASVVSKGLASMTFYNTNGEKTTYSNPESDQVWISYSYYQENVYTSNSKLGSKVLQIVDYNHLDSAARSAFADETYKTSVRQAAERVSNKRSIWDGYPKEHDYDEDLDLIKPIFNTHFNNVGGKVFDIYKARFALQHYNNINGWEDNQYTQNLNLCDELLNNGVEASLIDSKINQINSFYETYNLASWLYEYEASRICEQLIWSLDQYRKIATSQEIAEIESYVTSDVMVFHSYGDSLKQAFHEFGEKYIDPEYLDTYFFGVYGKDKSHIGDYASTLHYYFNKRNTASRELTIKGFYDDGTGNGKTSPIIDTEFAKSLGNLNEWLSASFEETNYVRPTDERYTYAITKTQYSEAQIKNLLSQKDTFFYEMTNSSYLELSMILDLINELKQIFLIIGIVFAGFAALMLLNFIASSISSQTKEIGILRAVGARGSDLFKIYFSASGILAAICLVIAIAGSAITCWRLNVSLGEALGISLLKFGILNVGIVLGGSILIALIGTFIPVLIASKKPPIDSIRTL